MKKRLLHGLGLALLLFSPMWITMGEQRNYVSFGVCAALGVLLLVLASQTPE
jgi:hypothetical protein